MGEFIIAIAWVKQSDLSTGTLLFALGAGVATTDNGYIQGGAISWKSPTQKINLTPSGIAPTEADQGAVVIANSADTLASAGPLDGYLRGYSFQGQTATLYYLDGVVWANRVTVDVSLMEQPTASLVIGGQQQDQVNFPLRDFGTQYGGPLQPTKYLGNNPVGGAGVEGTAADLIGKPKPMLFGYVQNITPPLVSSDLLIYEICTGTALVAVSAVRDGGVPLSASGATFSLAALYASAPAAGTYVTCYAGNAGYVRLGSRPVKNLLVDCNSNGDATGISPSTNVSHASLWSQISSFVGRTVDSASVTAANAVDSAPAGFWWGPDDAPTQIDAVNTVLTSFSGYEVYDPTAGKWKIAKLTAPSGTGVVNLVVLTPTARMGALDRKIVACGVARPNWTTNGAPPYQVNLQWGRCYTVMTPNDFAGGAPASLIAQFANDYRVSVGTVPNVWNPTTRTGAFPNAAAFTVTSGYTTKAGADTEQARLTSLVGAYSGCFQVSFIPRIDLSVQDRVFPGDVATMTLPRYGDPSHTHYRALQSCLTVDSNGPAISLVLGLEA